ncbi:MAG: DUF4178 domain-containing protein [Lachnospiraceae bacterium]|nr:DUF4178 domain-containing protein [Lachnospiraceae bacterium]
MHLRQGQVIYVTGTEYTVCGMIAFKEDTWSWEEYKLKSNIGQTEWLSVEEDDGVLIYSIYRERYDIPNSSSMNIMIDGENFELYEKGKATVTDYFGQVDVDRYERCAYTEYANATKDRFVSFESWDGEIEKSTGVLLRAEQVQITEEIRQVSSFGGSGFSFSGGEGSGSGLGNSVSKIVGIGILLIFLLPMMSTILNGLKSNQLSSYLENSSYFTYVTSVTNSTNNKKAKVYETTLSIEEAVKMIIDGVPENIETVSEVAKEEGEEGDNSVGLSTSKEYAYVYLSEDGKTYVQVSSKSFVSQNQNPYRSRYRRNRYYRTYSMGSYGNTNSSYTSYLNSARQSSVSSRTSSGGGTSYGK